MRELKASCQASDVNVSTSYDTDYLPPTICLKLHWLPQKNFWALKLISNHSLKFLNDLLQIAMHIMILTPVTVPFYAVLFKLFGCYINLGRLEWTNDTLLWDNNHCNFLWDWCIPKIFKMSSCTNTKCKAICNIIISAQYTDPCLKASLLHMNSS
jgi:hypothetical protein